MTDVLEDIDTIRSVLIAWEEGASDEKRMARVALRKLLQRKEDEVDKFEQMLDQEYKMEM
jgi:hypothetical protein|tara:strand:+ start:2743 stop:2922 length:180 start_codon:yes stop_codon:yes gene_type:complete